MKKIFLLFTMGLLIFASHLENISFADRKNKSDTIGEFEVGEELVYKVSYLFISLGEIRIKVVDKIKEPDRTVYKTLAYIDSYRGIPFVSLHEIYESIFDEKLYSYWFRERMISGSEIKYSDFKFDYPNKKVIIENGDWNKNVVESVDTIPIDTFSQDGLSLYFLARAKLFSNDTVLAPTVMMNHKGNAIINFYGKRKSVKIKAVDYLIDVIEFNGNANFVGVYGFTGDFEGWFSNDNARVPITAKLKVFLGKVRVELIDWKKKNWQPPRYKEN